MILFPEGNPQLLQGQYDYKVLFRPSPPRMLRRWKCARNPVVILARTLKGRPGGRPRQGRSAPPFRGRELVVAHRGLAALALRRGNMVGAQEGTGHSPAARTLCQQGWPANASPGAARTRVMRGLQAIWISVEHPITAEFNGPACSGQDSAPPGGSFQAGRATLSAVGAVHTELPSWRSLESASATRGKLAAPLGSASTLQSLRPQLHAMSRPLSHV